VHDDVASIGRQNDPFNLQDSEGPSPRTSRPSSITHGFEPFGKKASNSHPPGLFETFTALYLGQLIPYQLLLVYLIDNKALIWTSFQKLFFISYYWSGDNASTVLD
jgi:hypothetical protein